MANTMPENVKDRKARHRVALAFLILAAGAIIDLNPYLTTVGIIFSIIAIILLLAYRNYFTKKQKRSVYFSITLYVVIIMIVVAGFVTATLGIIQEALKTGFSSVIPASQINGLFNSIFPLLVLNAAAADGLCYYLLVMRLLHRIDHAIYLGALSISVALRVLVLALTYNGSFPVPQQLQNYLSVVRINYYDPYQFLLSIAGSLILGLLLLYVAIQISRGRVLRV